MEEPTLIRQRLSRYTSKQIAEYIKNWRKSGLSKKSFCHSSNINYYTFVGWTAPKKKKKALPASSSSFIPVKIRDSALAFAEVYYANGSRIVFHEAVGARYLRDITK
jgi:hypothetical protein